MIGTTGGATHTPRQDTMREEKIKGYRALMKVLIPVDGSAAAHAAVHWATAFLDKQHSQVYLLYVTEPAPLTVAKANQDKGFSLLAETRDYLAHHGVKVAETRTQVGHPASMICKTAEDLNVDQILLGSRDHTGLAGLILGQTARDVVDCTSKTVLIVKSHGDPSLTIRGFEHLDLHQADTSQPRQVLLVLYPDEPWEKPATWVAQLLSPQQTMLYLLSVLPYDPAMPPTVEDYDAIRQQLHQARAWFLQQGFAVAETFYMVNDPVQAITRYAAGRRVDQIILGSHPEPRQGLFAPGSTGSRVFQSASQPVLLLNYQQDTLAVSHLQKVRLTQKGQ